MSAERFAATDAAGLTGRRVVITGGSGGIGAATALRFASAGAIVAVADLDAEVADATAERINSLGLPGHVTGYAVDVSVVDSVYALASRVTTDLGGFEVWFNNAGVGSGGLLPEHEPE